MKENSKILYRKRHTVYNVAYHIIFCPKYRRSVLVNRIETRLKELLEEVALQKNWILERYEVMPDHVHLFVKVSPNDSPNHVVATFKGYSSFKLRSEFPELKSKLPSLWTNSYYIETIGHISEDTIKRYIENQKNH